MENKFNAQLLSKANEIGLDVKLNYESAEDCDERKINMENKDNACVALDVELIEMVKDLLHDVVSNLTEAGKNDYQDLTEEDCELYGAIVDVCGSIIDPDINKVD